MYWFVIYAARSRTRARVSEPHAGPPECCSWFRCPAPPQGRGQPLARYTAILAESGWRKLCEELDLDLERACLEEGRAHVCEAGPLPALFVEKQPAELPGITAAVLDVRECVVGPMAAIALELPDESAPAGAATEREVGICVAPLAESDAERERVRSLFAAVAFNVGGAAAELRCPDCASPELHWLGGTDLSQQMGCGNCGARLPRESAFLRLGDCEGILATAPQPAIAASSALPAAP
jgi:hypothetical protein